MPDSWQIVRNFERAVADFAGSTYGVAVDTCTWAIFLSLKWWKASGEITIPSKTYVGVPQYIIHAGCRPRFTDKLWFGEYYLDPYPIIDSACRFQRSMHIPNTFRCVSFNFRKHVPIGRGGMILHDDPEADVWLRRARYLGQDELMMDTRVPHFIGWHCFMEPARAADGLQRLSLLPNDYPANLSFEYPDCSKFEVFRD